MDWRWLEVSEEAAERLYGQRSIHPIIARILSSRGIRTPQEAEDFLHPQLSQLADPFAITHLREAVQLLERAVQERWALSIIGDYDVDGITSVTLLVRLLRHFGLEPQYFIPRRFTEGYGMSDEIVERLRRQSSPRLVMALDCGTNAVEQVRRLRADGIEVLILDHHQSNDALPADCVLVNPHIFDVAAHPPWLSLCSAGLVFKLIHGFLKHRRAQEDPRALSYPIRQELDLVAMGTIADLVPLVGENRILAHCGLGDFARQRRPGLEALCRVAQMPEAQAAAPEDIAFKLGPRINASGRLADAVLPVQMLLAENFEEARPLAQTLDEMNAERQRIERGILAEAEELFRQSEELPGIFFSNPGWHSGIVGIVCGKFARDHRRPCVVLGEERGLAKGSGRSVAGYDLVEILSPCASLLESWGGHPLAVGISLKPENVPLFQKAFQESVRAFRQKLSGAGDELLIAQTLSLEDIDGPFLADLENLRPFGQDNPEPVFALKGVHLDRAAEPFGKNRKHLRLLLKREAQAPLPCLYWNGTRRIPPAKRPLDLAIRLFWESWQGHRSIRSELLDWKLSGS
ncbi:MAG: single-stranded-DNA-specific exonuclease RecJ [Puniceicoccales bacterium]|nr:single-stranded-DNA-specific exonuclease RecJ [Puniceicoccales bacterium]